MSRRVYEYNYVHAEKGLGRGEGEGEQGGPLGGGRNSRFWGMERYNTLTLADKFKPIRATVLLEEELFAVGKLPCLTSFTFRRIRAIEVGNVLVAYVAEPNCIQFSIAVGREKSYERKIFLKKKTNQWILLASSNNPNAIECTGASPHLS